MFFDYGCTNKKKNNNIKLSSDMRLVPEPKNTNIVIAYTRPSRFVHLRQFAENE